MTNKLTQILTELSELTEEELETAIHLIKDNRSKSTDEKPKRKRGRPRKNTVKKDVETKPASKIEHSNFHKDDVQIGAKPTGMQKKSSGTLKKKPNTSVNNKGRGNKGQPGIIQSIQTGRDNANKENLFLTNSSKVVGNETCKKDIEIDKLLNNNREPSVRNTRESVCEEIACQKCGDIYINVPYKLLNDDGQFTCDDCCMKPSKG